MSLRFLHLRCPVLLPRHAPSRFLSSTSSSSSISPPVIEACTIVQRFPLVPPAPSPIALKHRALSAARERLSLKPFPPQWGNIPPKNQTLEVADFIKSGAPAAGYEGEAFDKFSTQYRSHLRCPSQFIYLLIKSADGSWTFPSIARSGADSMRATNQRMLQQLFGTMFNAQVLTNAPVAHIGRTFIYKAVYVNGSIEATEGGSVKDFAWLTGREAIALLKPQDEQQQRVWQTIL